MLFLIILGFLALFGFAFLRFTKKDYEQDVRDNIRLKAEIEEGLRQLALKNSKKTSYRKKEF